MAATSLKQKLSAERDELVKMKAAYTTKARELKAARREVVDNICFVAGRVHQLDQELARLAAKSKNA